MKNLTVALSLILIVMFLICWNHSLPYLYFQFLRVIAMFIFGILSYYDYRNVSKYFSYVFFVSIFVINPFFKVPMGRFFWNVLDTVWALILSFRVFYLIAIKSK